MQQNGNVALLSTARRESKIFSREETIGQKNRQIRLWMPVRVIQKLTRLSKIYDRNFSRKCLAT